jgi:hypothetical protein
MQGFGISCGAGVPGEMAPASGLATIQTHHLHHYRFRLSKGYPPWNLHPPIFKSGKKTRSLTPIATAGARIMISA